LNKDLIKSNMKIKHQSKVFWCAFLAICFFPKTFAQYRAQILDGFVDIKTPGGTLAVETDLTLAVGSVINVKTIPPLFASSRSPSEICKDVKKSTTLFSFENSNENNFEKISGELKDSNVFFMRGLVLISGNTTACAVLLPTDNGVITTFHGKMKGDIVGDVYLRSSTNLDRTFVYTNLFFAKSTIADNSYNISITTYTNIDGCKVSADLKVVTVVTPSKLNTDPRSMAVGYIDQATELNKTAVVATVNGVEKSCAKLHLVKSRTTLTKLQNKGSKAEITLSQMSPFDVTTGTFDLNGLNEDLTSLSVHQYPVYTNLKNKCSDNVIGDIYSAVSKKVTLNSGSKQQDIKLSQLSLYNENSVVGRSVKIISNEISLCGNIEVQNVEYTTLIARFRNGPVYGDMIFRQEKGEWASDTQYYHNLAHYQGNKTVKHKYHVHTNSITVGGDCKTTAGHYNPIDVELGEPYKLWCSKEIPQKCEVGDLSKKHGLLNIDNKLNTKFSQQFTTDSFLPLSGDYSIKGRSIVIHAENIGAARYSCADLVTLNPVTVAIKDLKLSQNSFFETTKVVSTLTGEISIRERDSSRLYNDEQRCSENTIGQVYNPFNITGEVSDGTQDMYKVGDLSGKKSVSTGYDDNLPLFNKFSVAGRAVKNGENCANLELNADKNNSFLAVATARFTYEQFEGVIVFKQLLWGRGDMSPTTVQVKLKTPEGSLSTGHKYHVHVDPTEKENSCEGVKGHYDPWNVNKENYMEACSANEQWKCEVGDLSKKHGRATVNDVTKYKLYNDVNLPLGGQHTIIGRSIKVHGSTAEGASVTSDHCASILPSKDETYNICFPTSTVYKYENFTQEVANALAIAHTRVIPMHSKESPRNVGGGCSCVLSYIVGSADFNNVEQLLDEIDALNPQKKCKSSKAFHRILK